MIRFIEVVNTSGGSSITESDGSAPFTLGEVWINGQYVVNVREAKGYEALLKEGRLPSDLDHTHRFTRITVNRGGLSEDHVVVGAPGLVAERLGTEKKQLLKG